MAQVKSGRDLLWSVQRTVDHCSGWSEWDVEGKESDIKKAGKLGLGPTMENLEYHALGVWF